MTHQAILLSAARLAEHGEAIVRRCRGISPAALNRYWQAHQALAETWSMLLGASCSHPTTAADDDAGQQIVWQVRLESVAEEVASCGVLVRVAATTLYAAGQRLDIPLARDVADRTASLHRRCAWLAAEAVAGDQSLAQYTLDQLGQLAQLCDRLSDLLCGVLLARLQVDRFVLDRATAADFAATFGPRPALVRLPVRRACQSLPAGPVAHRQLVERLEAALHQCLPVPPAARPGRFDPLADLQAMFAAVRTRPSDRAPAANRPVTSSQPTVSFPAMSFARLAHRLRRRES